MPRHLVVREIYNNTNNNDNRLFRNGVPFSPVASSPP